MGRRVGLEKTNLLPLTGFKHRTVQPVVLWFPAHQQILTRYIDGLWIELLNWMYSNGQTAGKKFTAFRMTDIMRELIKFIHKQSHIYSHSVFIIEAIRAH